MAKGMACRGCLCEMGYGDHDVDYRQAGRSDPPNVAYRPLSNRTAGAALRVAQVDSTDSESAAIGRPQFFGGLR
jgi:hypothetical protein